MRTILIISFSGLGFLLLTGICPAAPDSNEAPPDPAFVRKTWTPFFKPIPKAKPVVDSGVVKLGRHLFYDRLLSPDRSLSCNDCHDLSKFGANGTAAVDAREKETLKRDVPSLYNLADLTLLGWDAAHADLESQTAAALISPKECGMQDENAVVDRLKSMPRYTDHFKIAYGDDARITFAGAVEALTAFQEGLITRAPFDDFLLGDDDALSDEQLKGAILFDRKNCSACHTGSSVGGQMIQIAGIVSPWPNQKDLGHFEITGKMAHKMGFRVPPLRNVAETAPYFHDYSARSLRRAIRDIAIREQGMNLSLEEIRLIESFLKSLTGELPLDYIKPPGAE